MENSSKQLAIEHETYHHIITVKRLLYKVITELLLRADNHDKSKLEKPEHTLLLEYTDQQKNIKYGTKEYEDMLETLKPALDHHYKNNPHHPEYALYNNLTQNTDELLSYMNLIDLLEMTCDWLASIDRNKDGSIEDSMIYNKKRFNISDELYKILWNTIKIFE